MLSIKEFGWRFWQTDAGIQWPANLAHGLSSGAPSIVDPGADHSDADRRRDRDVHLGTRPTWSRSRSFSSRSCWQRSRRSSTVCGACSCSSRRPATRDRPSGLHPNDSAIHRPAAWRGNARSSPILAIMVIPFTSSVAREVLKSVPKRSGKPRTRWGQPDGRRFGWPCSTPGLGSSAR